jgi:hypothetical protein
VKLGTGSGNAVGHGNRIPAAKSTSDFGRWKHPNTENRNRPDPNFFEEGLNRGLPRLPLPAYGILGDAGRQFAIWNHGTSWTF